MCYLHIILYENVLCLHMFALFVVFDCRYYIVVSGRFLKLKCETILKTLRLAVIHESLFVM